MLFLQSKCRINEALTAHTFWGWPQLFWHWSHTYSARLVSVSLAHSVHLPSVITRSLQVVSPCTFPFSPISIQYSLWSWKFSLHILSSVILSDIQIQYWPWSLLCQSLWCPRPILTLICIAKLYCGVCQVCQCNWEGEESQLDQVFRITLQTTE